MVIKKQQQKTFTNQNPAASETQIKYTATYSPSRKTVFIGVKTRVPFLRAGAPADGFRRLRRSVIESVGYDFLGKLGDAMRERTFLSTKTDIANRSRHKCGDAIDINQEDENLIVVEEPQGLQTFFRCWLKCKQQDGTQGVNVELKDVRGFTANGWYFDFTDAAERIGWRRVPALKDWGVDGEGYERMEFWHYQLTEGLTFDEAIRFLYASNTANVSSVRDVRVSPVYKVLGLNDRGAAVRNLQDKLTKLTDEEGKPYLPREEVNGVYTKVLQTTIKRLQERYELDADGLVGPNTRQLIETLTK